MMCMAEVLWFAVDNSLRSDCSLSVINGVNEPLVDMLEEIIQIRCASVVISVFLICHGKTVTNMP